MTILDRFRLQGKVAIVTGAARGIGFEIAKALSEAGAIVHCADIDAAGAKAASAKITKLTGNLAFEMVVDVVDPESVRAAFSRAVTHSGRLDICFANAGIAEPALPRNFSGYTDDLWKRLIDVNLTGVWNTDRAAAELMIAQGSGTIVNTASIVGVVADAQYGCIGYATAKGGVVQLTRQLAVMLAGHGVRVNAIAPGYVATGMSEAEQLDSENPEISRLQAEVLARTPMKRFAQPHELGGIAVFLASEASSYCTGATYPVDGGWLAA